MPRRTVVARVSAGLGLALLLGGCAAANGDALATDVTVPTSTTTDVPSTGRAARPSETIAATPVAKEGTAAASQRKTFAPKRIQLASDHGVAAPVEAVDTGTDGTLTLPPDPGTVGWWVSGALAGELFGSVVLAGHIDSRTQGVGFFAALLDAKPEDRIALSGNGLRQTYVVRSNREVDKDVLSVRAGAFDRGVVGRLVLITCTGTFDRRTRHYDHNLVVTAEPLGVPVAG